MFLLDEDTRVLIQGITGNQGRFHTKAMLEYGTKVVAGVTPGKGGENIQNIPIYNSVGEAKDENSEINASILFVPARFCKTAVLESIQSKIPLMVIITEGIPVYDSLEVVNLAKKEGLYIVGPNCPGIISPRYKAKVGIMPTQFFPVGDVGLCSRSGTLSYEIAISVMKAGLGISTAVGIGGDPIIGPTISDILEKFEKDEETKVIVLIGEIGGGLEEASVNFIKKMSKPVIGYISGRTINLVGRRFGHAGALISKSGIGAAEHKVEALESVGVEVARYPAEVEKLIEKYR